MRSSGALSALCCGLSPTPGPLSPPPFLSRSPRQLIPAGAWSRKPHCFLLSSKASWARVEPQLFGHTTGMSPLAIVVAAGFWTLIWGAPGLLLSTPITACLVVLGRHVESLNFIELMLGDKPPLSPVQSFYQRILASDPDEVAFQAEGLLKTMPLLDYYEDVALPALALAQIDVARGVLEPDRQAQVCDAVERVLADLSDHV